MTHRHAFLFISCTLLAVSAVTACSTERLSAPLGLAPNTASASQGPRNGGTSGYQSPTFLTADSTAPSIANPVVTFWAKKGVNTEVRMVYHARAGHSDSTTFMWLRLRQLSLALYPDGSPIAVGDSVLITATLVDPVALKLDFQPSGLRFSTTDPAELKLSFKETLHDLNGDGVVNHLDADILRTIAIWRKESVTEPWLSVPSTLLSGAFEVQAKLGGFTGYAAAY